MAIYVITFLVLLVIVAAMAVGFILKQKELKGSCGGLGALGIDKACDCDEPCDRRKKRMAKEQVWKDNQIL